MNKIINDEHVIKYFSDVRGKMKAINKQILGQLKREEPDIENYINNRFKFGNQYTLREKIIAIFRGEDLEDKNKKLTDSDIIELFIRNNNTLETNYLNQKWLNSHPNYKNYLESRFSDLTKNEIKKYKIPYGLIVWMIYYKMEKLPTCKICKEKIYINQNVKNVNIVEYCSRKCQMKDKNLIDKRVETFKQTINSLNEEDPLRGKKIRDKREVTKAVLYPDDPHKGEFGSKKFKESMVKEYGVESWYQSLDYYLKKDIIEENRTTTLFDKYGSRQLMQINEFKEKREQTIESNISKNPNYYKKLWKSHTEDWCYNLLRNRFDKDDILRQYKEKRYPFHCDFYIKSLDLFIECNYYWAHQDHIFNPNDINDIEKLKEYKEKAKTKSGYNEVIKTWSLSDPKKVNTAKTNNLNYIIFWKSGKDYLDNIPNEIREKLKRFNGGENFIID